MRRKHRGVDEAEIDMTPMLDVTFIMLIFFIVTTSFVKEAGINVSRPSSAAAPTKQVNKLIVIEIRQDGTIVMDNRQIDVGSIRDNVQKDLAANANGTVVIVANGKAKAGLMVTAIDQARSAGAKKVSIATTGGGGGGSG
jgi:biopolymer transport protein ExbD